MRIIIEFDGMGNSMLPNPEPRIADTPEAKLIRSILNTLDSFDRGHGVLKKDISHNVGYYGGAAERDASIKELEKWGIIVRDPLNPRRMRLNRKWRYEE